VAARKPLNIKDILKWADQHREWTGRWPIRFSGPVLGQPGETWARICDAMSKGKRGLKKIPLTTLLAKRRNAQDPRRARADMTREQIIEWARLHHMRTGEWPSRVSGRVASAPDITWQTVDRALKIGGENLPGGETLPQLLRKEFFIWSRRGHRPLSIPLILKWADDHHARTGRWPIVMSGQIPRQKHTWAAINEALKHGRCGLKGGTTVFRLLREHRGAAYDKRLVQFNEKQVLDWADEYHKRHRRWPTAKSGYWPPAKAPWSTINRALREGRQGMPGGSSLSALLATKRKRAARPVNPQRA
jgi:hypothetical protein